MGAVNVAGVPANFVTKFWILPGSDLTQLFRRLKKNDLLFTIDAAVDGSDGPSVVRKVNDELKKRIAAGEPNLPPPPARVGEDEDDQRWEVLSCKKVKVKSREMRGVSGRNAAKQEAVEFKASSDTLAPADYKVDTLAKTFGFKNPLRMDDSEPEMFIAIGR